MLNANSVSPREGEIKQGDFRIRKVLQVLKEDPSRTLPELAHGCQISMSRLSHLFKREIGTNVKIYLPRLIGDAREVKPNISEPMRTGDRSEVILVVEDDSLMRRLASEALHELGYTVFDSENAANALAILDRESSVKLLFTDVVMPDINGKKLADEAVRRRPALKVLFTTGYTPNAVVHGGVLDPGVHLISKPFTLDQLAAKVRSVLDG